MFISSYNTHVQINNSEKLSKERFERQNAAEKSFSSKLASTIQPSTLKSPSTPVDYISKGLVLNNKLELENQKNGIKDSKKNNLDNFTLKSSLLNAKTAYEGNTKMFSLVKIPNVALNQTPSFEMSLPKEPQEIKELHARHKMINTYIANENYYRVTA